MQKNYNRYLPIFTADTISNYCCKFMIAFLFNYFPHTIMIYCRSNIVNQELTLQHCISRIIIYMEFVEGVIVKDLLVADSNE
jgi:hypothetical protein